MKHVDKATVWMKNGFVCEIVSQMKWQEIAWNYGEGDDWTWWYRGTWFFVWPDFQKPGFNVSSVATLWQSDSVPNPADLQGLRHRLTWELPNQTGPIQGVQRRAETCWDPDWNSAATRIDLTAESCRTSCRKLSSQLAVAGPPGHYQIAGPRSSVRPAMKRQMHWTQVLKCSKRPSFHQSTANL